MQHRLRKSTMGLKFFRTIDNRLAQEIQKKKEVSIGSTYYFLFQNKIKSN